MDQEPARSMTHEVKKKSPSTVRRNMARKQKFLEDRKQTTKTSFKCDQCDHEANCKVSLRKHMGKDHKKIPQIDGFEDINSVDENISQNESINVKEVEEHINSLDATEKSSQTEDVNVKQVEAQTESIDTMVAVKWGQHGHLSLPSGTVVLKHQDKSTAVDYPVMSSPVTWVFHPLWGLGKYDDKETEDEDEHISYRFDGNEIHTGGMKKV